MLLGLRAGERLAIALSTRGIEHEKCPFVVLAAEGAFFCRIADLDHEVDQVLDWEDTIVEHWVLRVDRLDKGPEFGDDLAVMNVHPEIRREHQVQEELLTQSWLIDEESELCDELDGLAIYRHHVRVTHWETTNYL